MSGNILFLKSVEKKLKKAAVLSPSAEAEEMIRHFGQLDRVQLFTGQKEISGPAKLSIAWALQKRRSGVPLAYLLGQAPFFGRSFQVTPDVLIPRPETERLVEEAVCVLKAHFRARTPELLDLGTGSGCVAASLTLEWPACRMTALDASEKALSVARKNFRLLGLHQKIRTVKSTLFENIGGEPSKWDVIVSNPPYVPRRGWGRLPREVRREPRLALDGGPDGLDLIYAILEEAPKHLKRDGWLLMEIGKGQSAKILKKWARRKEYTSLSFKKDLNGIERILVAKVDRKGTWTN